MKHQNRTAAPDRAAKAARDLANGYGIKASALITAGEALRLVDSRVAILVAHWEKERRDRAWHRRLRRAIGRALARADEFGHHLCRALFG